MKPEIAEIIEKTDNLLKGGPGSGSWNGPASPRFSRQGKPKGDEEVLSKATFKDISKQIGKNLKEINSQKISEEKVSGKLSTENIVAIGKNMKVRLNLYSQYLAGDTAMLARDYIDIYQGALTKGEFDGSLKGIDSKHLNRMGIDGIKKIIHQEIESNRQQFTDHGVRHIVGNIDRQIKIMQAMGRTTGKEELMAHFIMTNHDVGYTASPVRQGGSLGVEMSRKHKLFSEKIASEQSKFWNEGKIFSKKEYDNILDIIKHHDETEINPKDKLRTSTSLSDNLSLFSKEKLPTMFRNIKGGDDILIKMGIASKNNDIDSFEKHRKELYKKIDKANLSSQLKRDLKSATKEISYLTPKFTMGVLAGEVTKIGNTKEGKIRIDIKYNSYDRKMQELFDMGQRQTKKLLEDYGYTDFSKTTYNIGGMVTLNVFGTTRKEIEEMELIIKSFQNHRGRPGKVGGSLPKEGASSSAGEIDKGNISSAIDLMKSKNYEKRLNVLMEATSKFYKEEEKIYKEARNAADTTSAFLKKKSQEKIISKLVKDEEFIKEIKEVFKDRVEEIGTEEAIKEVVRQCISSWAVSSGDHQAYPIAMQKAIADEFGIKDANIPPFNTKNKEIAVIKKVADDIYGLEGKVMRKVVRAQYELTQEFFEKKGIKEVALFRGVGGSSIDYLSEKDRKKGFGDIDISMMPASSFSFEPYIAHNFSESKEKASFMISIVPTKKILSTPHTGFGCLNEGEAVVLGGGKNKSTAFILYNSGDIPKGHKDAYYKDFGDYEVPKFRADDKQRKTSPFIVPVLEAKNVFEKMLKPALEESKKKSIIEILKGGPGSGNWEGPGNPRYAHQGKPNLIIGDKDKKVRANMEVAISYIDKMKISDYNNISNFIEKDKMKYRLDDATVFSIKDIYAPKGQCILGYHEGNESNYIVLDKKSVKRNHPIFTASVIVHENVHKHMGNEFVAFKLQKKWIEDKLKGDNTSAEEKALKQALALVDRAYEYYKKQGVIKGEKDNEEVVLFWCLNDFEKRGDKKSISEILKGGPGSGSWNGPASPRFSRQGGKEERGSKEPITKEDKNLYDSIRMIRNSMGEEVLKDHKYKGPYDMVLKEGRFFKVQERPKNIEQGEMKNCYANAGRLALENSDYTYCEGYGTTKQFGFPFAHAWCIDRQGKVVDPTWKDGSSYYGIKFDTDYLRKTILKTGYWGLIPDYPSKKYNPFKNGFEKDAITKGSEKIDYEAIKDKLKDYEKYNYIEVYFIKQKVLKSIPEQTLENNMGNGIYFDVKKWEKKFQKKYKELVKKIIEEFGTSALEEIKQIVERKGLLEQKGGPGSGNWEGPGNPRYAHQRKLKGEKERKINKKKLIKELRLNLLKASNKEAEVFIDEDDDDLKFSEKKKPWRHFLIEESITKAVDEDADEMDWNDPWVRQEQTIAGLLQARFDVLSPKVQDFIRERSYRFSFDTNDYTTNMLKEQLNAGFEAGESIGKLKNRMKNVFGFGEGREANYRATRIARSESIRASNYGSMQGYIQSGVVGGKEWYCARGERTCAYCSSMHGRIIGVEENFYNRGDRISITNSEGAPEIMRLDYEDIKAPPLHPNCRCTLLPKVKREIFEERPSSVEGASPFSSGNVESEAEFEDSYSLNSGTMYKVKIDGDGDGLLKYEDLEIRKHSDSAGFYDQCKRMLDLRACSMSKREVLASEIDKLLETNLIPETVWKTGKRLHRTGSCQQFIDDFSPGTYGVKSQEALKQEIIDAGVFDDVLGMTDRHQGNFGTGPDGKLWFIDNGTTFAHTPEKAWNGTFFDCGGRGVLSNYGLNSGSVRKQEDYIARGRILANKAIAKKVQINESFDKWGLPIVERNKFWERIAALNEGKFFEYKNSIIREITGGLNSL